MEARIPPIALKSVDAGGLLIDGHTVEIDVEEFHHSRQEELLYDGVYATPWLTLGYVEYGKEPQKVTLWSVDSEAGVLSSVVRQAINEGHTASAHSVSFLGGNARTSVRRAVNFKKFGPILFGVCDSKYTYDLPEVDGQANYSRTTLSIGRLGLKRALGLK